MLFLIAISVKSVWIYTNALLQSTPLHVHTDFKLFSVQRMHAGVLFYEV